jgi:peptidoglycan/LPS O-acetylase OafA/YrhL
MDLRHREPESGQTDWRKSMDRLEGLSGRQVTVAAWIFVVVSAIVGIQAIADALPKHAFDMSWPDHARFHVTVGAASQFGFALSTVLIALIPFRRGERWSWWALLSFALLGVVVLIPATLWHDSGPPPGAWGLIGACIVAMLVALSLTARIGIRGSGRGSGQV